jgi:predicted TIM-barrel fold metal-dependent hydrolase
MNSTNFVANADPTHLTNLFFLYPQVRWDIFHIGYPFQEKLSVLAKCFANVFVDFSWMHIVSPEVCRRAMSEYLEMLACNKILGFGGDFIYAELTYAHAKMARRVMAQVLATKVKEGYCNEVEAVELGRRILYENPAALFFEKRTAPLPELMPFVPLAI